MDRKEAGRRIAFEQPGRVIQDSQGKWHVGSADKLSQYEVDLRSGRCSCPDKTFSGDALHRCKHFWAVWFVAPLPVVHAVRRIGPEAWGIAVLRGGIRVALVCPRPSLNEAYAAKGRLEREEAIAYGFATRDDEIRERSAVSHGDD